MLFSLKKEFLVATIIVTLFTVFGVYSSTVSANENDVDGESHKTITSEELLKTSQEINRLEAEIEKQQLEYTKRPKRKFVGARTKDAQIALYMEKWRQKVERAGNLNYPQEARDKQIYGKVQVTTSIKSNGELESVEINKSSGEKVLDDAVVKAVNKAAPFEPFNVSMKEKIDILSITRTFNYTHEELSMAEDWVLTEIKKQINVK